MTYPRRALYAGAIFSLEGILTVYDEELDYSCGSSVQGFKVKILIVLIYSCKLQMKTKSLKKNVSKVGFNLQRQSHESRPR